MTTNDGASGFGHYIHSTLDHLRRHLKRQFVSWPGQILKGSKRLGTHRINIAESVGGGDSTPVLGRIHHGCKHVDRLDQGASITQRIHAGIVTRVDSDKKIGVLRGWM